MMFMTSAEVIFFTFKGGGGRRKGPPKYAPVYKVFADERGYLIMSVSRNRTTPTLHYSVINNITYAVKTLYSNSPDHFTFYC